MVRGGRIRYRRRFGRKADTAFLRCGAAAVGGGVGGDGAGGVVAVGRSRWGSHGQVVGVGGGERTL